MKSYPIFLDHVFVLTEPGAEIAERLIDIGMVEGSANTHPGQGTSNRRFFLENFTIELAYVSDENEAKNGAGRDLKIVNRTTEIGSSPFGIVSRVTDPASIPEFENWQYYPDYFNENMCFYVGCNSSCLTEPLCICMPPELPLRRDLPEEYANHDWKLSSVVISVPVKQPTAELAYFSGMEKLHIEYGNPHRLTICLNEQAQGKSLDLGANLPVTIEW